MAVPLDVGFFGAAIIGGADEPIGLAAKTAFIKAAISIRYEFSCESI